LRGWEETPSSNNLANNSFLGRVELKSKYSEAKLEYIFPFFWNSLTFDCITQDRLEKSQWLQTTKACFLFMLCVYHRLAGALLSKSLPCNHLYSKNKAGGAAAPWSLASC
jgi:hypothetical protein